MSLKVKLISCISAFIVVLSLMLISVFAATNVSLYIGGNISFTANSVNALITGSIAGNAAGGSTLTTIDIDASDPDGPVSMPPDWTSMDLTFTESASPITVTINIQNRSTDREIAVSLTDSTKISNVTVTRECDGASINASDSRNIPGGETITYTFELNVQSQNSSANGAFSLSIGLETPGPQTYGYFTFEVNDDGKTVTLTDYNPSLSDSTDITIPSTVDLVDGVWQDGTTYTVTAIASASSYSNGVFYNSGITSIAFPSTLQSIGSYAFRSCRGLAGELDLSNCTSLTSIGNFAFGYCDELTGELDLSNCTSLTSIGSDAFYECSGLNSISFPSSLTSIGDSAFSFCDGLTGELNLSNCINLANIGDSGFYNCDGLTGELDFSNCISLTSIGDRAFYNCGRLTGVELPVSLTSIGSDAFSNCSRLTSITLPSSLTSIGDKAFKYCSGLTGIVTIPASVNAIGANPFEACTGLEDIVLEEGNSEYYIEGHCLIEESTKTLILGFNDSIIPSNIKIIGDSAFHSCYGLTGELVIPAGVTSIGRSAFQYCSRLTSITLPSSLTSIGDYAFSYWDGLTSITLPSSLISIGSFAFYSCSSLTSVTFENTAGWYVTTWSTSTSGTPVDVTNSSINASNLTGQYYNYYWKRNG